MNLTNEHLTAEDVHTDLYGNTRETAAPYCDGPGHLFETDDDGWVTRIEDCPTCARGPVRNHLTFRGTIA